VEGKPKAREVNANTLRHKNPTQRNGVPSVKLCGGVRQLQFDHIIAYSKGGKASIENMQLLCRVHNAFKGDC
jgi:5-methylcytosine-specific restriction endonuclease McrA